MGPSVAAFEFGWCEPGRAKTVWRGIVEGPAFSSSRPCSPGPEKDEDRKIVMQPCGVPREDPERISWRLPCRNPYSNRPEPPRGDHLNVDDLGNLHAIPENRLHQAAVVFEHRRLTGVEGMALGPAEPEVEETGRLASADSSFAPGSSVT